MYVTLKREEENIERNLYFLFVRFMDFHGSLLVFGFT